MSDHLQLPVCIIGAGSSGITAAKSLKQKGIPFDCFEIGSDLGGMWRYENDNGRSAAYRSLHIDTSRQSLSYPDFPVPDQYPDFLSHAEVLQYLEAYADQYDVRRHIRFNTRVEKVEPAGDDTWRVTLHDGSHHRYRAVIVANGHLWDPRWAQFAGSFNGEQMHSHAYRTAAPFEGRRVLIVGIGNSAVDIAVDVCKSAQATFLSTRRSAWIMPKYIMGRPIDRWLGFFAGRLHLPTAVARTIVKWTAYAVTGDQARFGIPRPKHPIWREHATLSQELIPYCGHGWIKVRPNVARLDGDTVWFEDGSSERVDVIIHATGYHISFPFLSPSLFRIEDGRVNLYRRMVAPDRPGLYFLGLVQPVGPTIPLVEVQGRWLAGVLAGDIPLPTREQMDREIDAHHRDKQRRYVNAERYVLEVDGRGYRKQLVADMALR
jgi:dimethylaniline monooxygenase (N-oxide forming)